MNPDFTNLLSDELLLHVFSFLPTHDLMRQKKVCKRFYAVANDKNITTAAVLKLFDGITPGEHALLIQACTVNPIIAQIILTKPGAITRLGINTSLDLIKTLNKGLHTQCVDKKPTNYVTQVNNVQTIGCSLKRCNAVGSVEIMQLVAKSPSQKFEENVLPLLNQFLQSNQQNVDSSEPSIKKARLS